MLVVDVPHSLNPFRMNKKQFSTPFEKIRNQNVHVAPIPFFALAAALFFAFFAAFLLALESAKVAPGGPEVAVKGNGSVERDVRYFPGLLSSGGACARLKEPVPLDPCGGT
jgi:hypothetical protein|mmetsp:Transcript_1237/g.4084  ORF Transcript_1237/g.4084 Transcript_1237/m.4084 type:complete len:111 (-) Transcript_1237:1453-1785(-)